MIASQEWDSLLQDLLRLDPTLRRAEIAGHGERADASLVGLADACEKLAFREVGPALECSQMLVTLADELQASRGRVRARRAYAQALSYSGRFEEALQTCHSALEIADQAAEPLEAARIRLAMLHPLGELARYEEALQAGEIARCVFEQHGERTLAGRADINLGVIHQNRNDAVQALQHLDRARCLLTDDALMVGFIENNRGEALLLMHRFQESEQAFEASVRSSQKAGATLAEAIAQGNLADLAARRGDLACALRRFESARQRFEADSARSHAARIAAEQAEAIETLGLPENALDAYQQAIVQLEQQGLTLELARARAGLGRALLKLGRLDEAEAALEDAGERFRSLGQVSATVDAVRIDLAITRQDKVAAARLIAEIKTSPPGSEADLALRGRLEARFLLSSGEFQKAGAVCDLALETALKFGLSPLQADLLHLRGRARRGLDDLAGAIGDFLQAIDLIERTRGTLQAERFRAAFLGDRVAVYEDCIAAILDRNDPAAVRQAWALMGQAKSRALSDVVTGELPESAAHGTSPVLAGQIHSHRAELNALYSQIADALQFGRASVLDGNWRAAVQTHERALSELELRLDSTARPGAGSSGVAESGGDLAAQLPGDTALIEYYVVDGALMAITAFQGNLRAHRAPADLRELQRVEKRLSFHLARGARGTGARAQARLEDVRRELKAIFDLALRPVLRDLSAPRKLVMIPHGLLHRIPLHAAWTGQRYVAQDYETAYCPSVAVLGELLRRSRAAALGGGQALVVGVADETAPAVRGEVERIAELTGARVLFDHGATLDLVKGALPEAAVAHFATHGWYSEHAADSSGLKLADGWLTARDIARLRLRAELVALSGCETGRSALRKGDEILGLLRAFLSAGAAAILASLWPVQDEIAKQMMSQFYEVYYNGRKQGGPSAAACLRQVQLEWLKLNPHPGIWAPFFLVGVP